jgi:hypothetical protein
MTPKKAIARSPGTVNARTSKVEEKKGTPSQQLAKLTTNSDLSAITLQKFAGAGDTLQVHDLLTEMRKAGDEAVAGDLGRVERMLANQLLSLDALFNNLAQRAGRQDTLKGIEVMMRLALKAQAQSRSTAETLAVIKNPMPFIKQANISQGHQQINNGQQGARAEDFQNAPNKLLEVNHGNQLDAGTTAATGRAHQGLEALGAGHRATHP